jgi:hypothetical protein
MDRLTIHESSQISVWCYPKLGIVHHEMHDFCYGSPFRAGLEAGAAALRQFNAVSWLSDDRSNGAVPAADEEWAVRVWFPTAKAAGWRNWAMIRPELAVGRLNVRRVLADYQQLGIKAQFFSDVDLAFSWLRGLTTQPVVAATR